MTYALGRRVGRQSHTRNPNPCLPTVCTGHDPGLVIADEITGGRDDEWVGVLLGRVGMYYIAVLVRFVRPEELQRRDLHTPTSTINSNLSDFTSHRVSRRL